MGLTLPAALLAVGATCWLIAYQVVPIRALLLQLPGEDSMGSIFEEPPDGRRFAAPPPGVATYRARYSGWLEIERAGTYQFAVTPAKLTKLRVGDGTAGESLPLRRGRYRIELEYLVYGDKPEPLTISWARDLPLPEAIPGRAVVPPDTPAWRSPAARWLRRAGVLCWFGAVWVVVARRLGRKTHRRALFAMAAMTLSLTAVALMLESVLRLVGAEPPELTAADTFMSDFWVRRPGPGETLSYSGWLPLNVKEFETQIKINAAGWRDRDYPQLKKPGTFRILVIGDSYVEAKEVALELTFHKRLEQQLAERCGQAGGQLEVMALGRGGTSTTDHLTWLQYYGPMLNPDLVILSVFPGNDVLENSEELSWRYDRWVFGVYARYIIATKLDIREHGLLLERSWLNRWLVYRAMELHSNFAALFHKGLEPGDEIPTTVEIYRPGGYDAAWSAAWDTTFAAIEGVAGAARTARAEFLVMIVHSAQLPGLRADEFFTGEGSKLDPHRPTKMLVEFCTRAGIECVDLEPKLSDNLRRTGSRYSWRHDGHWNETGHRLVAEVLAARLGDRIERGCGSSVIP